MTTLLVVVVVRHTTTTTTTTPCRLHFSVSNRISECRMMSNSTSCDATSRGMVFSRRPCAAALNYGAL
jgi:hypothetical protein